MVGGADMGRGGDGEDIDLPNLPDQAENPDPDQEDDLPMNAGGIEILLTQISFLCLWY